MRVLIVGGKERADRLAGACSAAGWSVVVAKDAEGVGSALGGSAGQAGHLDAVVLLPADLAEATGDSATARLLAFLEGGLLGRIRTLAVITAALGGKGAVRFVQVAGNVPPKATPDDQAGRARIMAAAGRAAAADAGPASTSKVLGPSAGAEDIVAALTPTGKTPAIVWDLPDAEADALSFADWRLAVLQSHG